MQEKRLVDLYLDNKLDLTIINQKNDSIKSEIDKLNRKKLSLDPDNDYNENIGIKYESYIEEKELKELEKIYDVLFLNKMKNQEYSQEFIKDFLEKTNRHFYIDGYICRPYVEDNIIKDIAILVSKDDILVAN